MSERKYPAIEEAELNNENYNPKDNSTYMSKPYSKDMQSDVECHMFANPNASVVHRYNEIVIRGDFSVQSTKSAEDKVLQYPTATQLSLTKIQDVRLQNLVPESLMVRYERNPNAATIYHKTPIFYDKGINKFVQVFDIRTLKDMNENELSLDDVKNKVFYRLKNGGTALGLSYETVPELIADNKSADGSFAALSAAYVRYFLSKSNGEEVIFIQYICKKNESLLAFRYQHRPFLNNLILNQVTSFEFTKAVRFESDFYLIDEDGKINRDSVFSLKYNEETNTWTASGRDLGQDNDINVIVLKYTEKDWQIVRNIYARMNAIANDLHTLFEQTKAYGDNNCSGSLADMSSRNFFLEDKR